MPNKGKGRIGADLYDSISQDDLPFGRKGKHHKIIARILRELEGLDRDRALRIPLDELPDTKANIRSALNRAAKLKGISMATSSDDNYLFIWVPETKN